MESDIKRQYSLPLDLCLTPQFCNILGPDSLGRVYLVTVVDSIEVVCALPHSALLHYVYDFKAAQKNVQNLNIYALRFRTGPQHPRKVSGEPGISLSGVVHHLDDQRKSIWRCGIVTHVAKIFQNF